MERFLIEEAKCGVADTVPMISVVISSVKFSDGKKSQWLNLTEVDGIPTFHLTDEDVFDILMRDDFGDEETDMFDNALSDEFFGIDLLGGYDEIFDSIYDDPENPVVPFIRYIIALTRCKIEDEKELVEAAVGKYVDEIKVPISDAEDDYLSKKGE